VRGVLASECAYAVPKELLLETTQVVVFQPTAEKIKTAVSAVHTGTEVLFSDMFSCL